MIAALTSALVIFREGFEALLLIMLMSGMTKGARLDWRALGMGLIVGAVGSTLLALWLHDWAEDHVWFEAAIDLAAAGVLAYVVIWNRHVQAHIQAHLREVQGRSLALTTAVISLIFLREGAEIVLMLAAAMRDDAWSTAMGGVSGAAALASIGYVTMEKLLPRLDIGMVFRWSNAALAALAAWFLVQGIAQLAA